jgi:preprotein translocase subunit SecF
MDFRNRNIDLVGKQNLWFGLSLVLVLVGMVSWAMFGLNRGIDFRGGTQVQYRLPVSQRPTGGKDVALVQEVRGLLEKAGLQSARAQIAGGDTLVVNAPALSQSEQQSQQRRIYEVLSPRLRGTDASGKPQELRLIGQQFVGPVIGKELTRNAILGVVVGVCLIAAWIFLRYNFGGDGMRYAVAGIFALVHDVLVLIGIFALIGHIDPRIEVDGSFIAALLTVVGYSINDSVVIFDRLRENLRVRRNEPFNKVVNDSLLETMSRSINTGLTVLIMLFALLLFGGESIYNFVLAMLVGIASGLYSSIFNASMVLVAWNRWEEKKRLRARGTTSSRGMATATSGAASTRARSTSTPNAPRAATATSQSTPRRATFATAPLSSPANVETSGATIAATGDIIPSESSTSDESENVETPGSDGAPMLLEDGATEDSLASRVRKTAPSTPRVTTKARARRRH